MPAKIRVEKISARYPNGQGGEAYINSLVLKYTEKYTEIWHNQVTEEQIRMPIKSVVSLISSIIESPHIAGEKMLKIKFLKRFAKDEKFRPERILETYDCYTSLYCFRQGMKNAPLVFLKRVGLPFPEEHQETYLSFTKEMTCDAILGITEATERFIQVLTRREEDFADRPTLVEERPLKKKTSVTFFDNSIQRYEKHEKHEKHEKKEEEKEGELSSNNNRAIAD
jgi:hypothetical protein